jgi:hypothetical protein
MTRLAGRLNATRPWWRFHGLSYAAFGLLLAALTALNLPLYSWADARERTGASGMWAGWPQGWLHVVVTFGELEINEIDLRWAVENALIVSGILFAGLAATEFLIREFGAAGGVALSHLLAHVTLPRNRRLHGLGKHS